MNPEDRLIVDKLIINELYRRLHYPLDILKELGGYYECPRDVSGKRLGPLVGYAGKDSQGRQYVGDIYANFCEMEQWPFMLSGFGYLLIEHDGLLKSLDCLCGAPLGGMTFGPVMADLLRCRYIFPEKVVTALATNDEREQTTLKFARHKVRPGERIGIVEDVVNNFSTTESLIKMIADAGATVEAIVCLLNRSLTFHKSYLSQTMGKDLPVLSVVSKPIEQWQQDDPEVAEDVAAGNVVWKPKNEWNRLMAAMAKYKNE